MYEALSVNVLVFTFFIFLFHGINPIEKLLQHEKDPSFTQRKNFKLKEGSFNEHRTPVQAAWISRYSSSFHQPIGKIPKPVKNTRNAKSKKVTTQNVNSKNEDQLDTQIEAPHLDDGRDAAKSNRNKGGSDRYVSNTLRKFQDIPKLKSRQSSKFIERDKKEDLTNERLVDKQVPSLENENSNQEKKNHGVQMSNSKNENILDKNNLAETIPKVNITSQTTVGMAGPTTDQSAVNITDNINNSKTTANVSAQEVLQESNDKANLNADPSEDMPSFDEWKKQRLEEQEKTDQSIPPATNNQKGKPKSKVKKNYASSDCGAKILATNSESHHSSHILNAFKDEYMLNPCNAKIWFVVELCESIQPHTLEIANFELFSSVPKEFSVYASERYPSREWTVLGHFNGKDERILQEFSLSGQIFGKYIKVELSSHYGSEHYCPLSLFQVYGTSMVEEIEGIETPESSHEHEEDDEDSLLGNRDSANGNNQNLFGSAKDAVLQIVKTAAKAFTGEEEHQYVINGSKDYDEKSEILSPSTIRSEINLSLEELTISNISRIIYELNKTLGLVDYKGAPNLLSFNFLSRLSEILNTCSMCKSKSNSKVVTKIESSLSCKYLQVLIGPAKFNIFCQLFKVFCSPNIKNQNSLKHFRDYSTPFLSIFRRYFCSSILAENLFTCKRDELLPSSVNYSADSIMNATEFDYVHKDRHLILDNISTDTVASAETQMESTQPSVVPSISDVDSVYKNSDKKVDKTDKVSDFTEPSATQSPLKSINMNTASETVQSSTVNDQSAPSAGSVISSKSISNQDSLTSSSIAPSVVSKIEESIESKTESLQPKEDPPSENQEQSFDKDSPVIDTDAIARSVVTESNNGNDQSADSKEKSSGSIESTKKENVKSSEEDNTVDVKVETSPSQATTEQTVDPVQSSSQAYTQQQSATTSQSVNGNQGVLPGGQKESVFMRLSNKIKSLELNLSLSSQYLEALSKSYRKRMDEMTELQKVFNKSMALLNMTSQKSINKSNILESRIQNLETEISNLTRSYLTLMMEKENLASTLIEWHVILIVVELIAMAAIFVACVRYNTHRIMSTYKFNSITNNGDKVIYPKQNASDLVLKEQKSSCGTKDFSTFQKKKKNRMKRHQRSHSNDMNSSIVPEVLNSHLPLLRPQRVSIDSSVSHYKQLSGPDHHTLKALENSKHSSAGLLFKSSIKSNEKLPTNLCKKDASMATSQHSNKNYYTANKEHSKDARSISEVPDSNHYRNKYTVLSNINHLEDLVNKNRYHNGIHLKKKF